MLRAIQNYARSNAARGVRALRSGGCAAKPVQAAFSRLGAAPSAARSLPYPVGEARLHGRVAPSAPSGALKSDNHPYGHDGGRRMGRFKRRRVRPGPFRSNARVVSAQESEPVWLRDVGLQPQRVQTSNCWDRGTALSRSADTQCGDVDVCRCVGPFIGINTEVSTHQP